MLKNIFHEVITKNAKKQGNSNSILKSSGSTLIIKISGAVLSFILQLVLARILGAEQYGIYVYVISWIFILIIPAKMGFDTLFSRNISVYYEKKEWSLLNGILKYGKRIVIIVSIVVSILLVIIVYSLRDLVSDDLRLTFYIASISVPMIAILELHQAALRAFHEFIKGVLPLLLLQPLIMLLLIGATFIFNNDLNAVIVIFIYTISIIFSLIICTYWFYITKNKKTRSKVAEKRMKGWLVLSLPMMLTDSFSLINIKADILLIGMLIGTKEAGIYAIASKLALTLKWALESVNKVVAPYISGLYSKNHNEELQKILTNIVITLVIFILPFALGLIIFGESILNLFGNEFVVGYSSLVILCIGNFINISFGPVEFLLMMTSHQRETSVIMGLTVILNILLNYFLISIFGIFGAALATAISMMFWNSVMYFVALKMVNLDPSILSILRK